MADVADLDRPHLGRAHALHRLVRPPLGLAAQSGTILNEDSAEHLAEALAEQAERASRSGRCHRPHQGNPPGVVRP